MTLWLAYVPAGAEFDLVEDCEVLGITARVPRKVEAVRTGNNRWPEPRVTAYLPNYAFVEATAEEYYWLKDIRYVRDIMGIPPGKPADKIEEFIQAVEAQFAVKNQEIEQAMKTLRNREASKQARREAIKAMQSYQPSDLLEVIVGPFAGTIMAFGRMVESAARLTPEIEATMTLFGRKTSVRLDPLHVKKVG